MKKLLQKIVRHKSLPVTDVATGRRETGTYIMFFGFVVKTKFVPQDCDHSQYLGIN